MDIHQKASPMAPNEGHKGSGLKSALTPTAAAKTSGRLLDKRTSRPGRYRPRPTREAKRAKLSELMEADRAARPVPSPPDQAETEPQFVYSDRVPGTTLRTVLFNIRLR